MSTSPLLTWRESHKPLTYFNSTKPSRWSTTNSGNWKRSFQPSTSALLTCTKSTLLSIPQLNFRSSMWIFILNPYCSFLTLLCVFPPTCSSSLSTTQLVLCPTPNLTSPFPIGIWTNSKLSHKIGTWLPSISLSASMTNLSSGLVLILKM